MKNIIVVILFLTGISAFAQDVDVDVDVDVDSDASSNVFEFKTNLAYLAFGVAEVAMEYSLNRNSAIGVSGGLAYGDEAKETIEYLVAPYYRYYFGNNQTEGFFLEGFGLVNSIEREVFVEDDDEYVTDLALGIGLGGKWITNGGLVGEINFGIGPNILNTDEHEYNLVPKAGISIGYRF